MAKESKVSCKSNFKNLNTKIVKAELNEKMAKIICRAENLSFGEDLGKQTKVCFYQQYRLEDKK